MPLAVNHVSIKLPAPNVNKGTSTTPTPASLNVLMERTRQVINARTVTPNVLNVNFCPTIAVSVYLGIIYRAANVYRIALMAHTAPMS